jgi:hypothetical protein
VGADPLDREEGADGVGGLTGDGANRSESTAGEVLRRFSVVVLVSGGRGGGLAWTGVGYHGGGVNLVGGCSERSVHDEVAGSATVRSAVRPSSATGKAKMVSQDRGEVVKLMS